MGINITDLKTIKVGDENCKIYLGDTLLYPQSQPQTLQWVTFNNGDTIPTTLDIYGVKGNASDLSNVMVGYPISFTASRRNVDIQIDYGCYNATVSDGDDVELIFSEIGCSDYYNINSDTTVYGATIQLLIYA